MTIFANDYTERNLTGDSSTIFKIVNTIITIVPMIVITYVLFRLFQNIFQKYLATTTIIIVTSGTVGFQTNCNGANG
mgnify:CR=1 FL=1